MLMTSVPKFLRLYTPVLLSTFMLFSTHSYADTREQLMFSKYLKYGFCMEKTFGQPWDKNSKLATAMNRWGSNEPTLRAISMAAREVQDKDKQCRFENGIEDEPRPQ